MGRPRKRSRSERRDAVLSLLRQEESAGSIARRLGVSEATLYRWRDVFLAGGDAALESQNGQVDARDRRIAELESQIAKRDQVIGEYTIANRLLKKLSEPSD